MHHTHNPHNSHTLSLLRPRRFSSSTTLHCPAAAISSETRDRSPAGKEGATWVHGSPAPLIGRCRAPTSRQQTGLWLATLNAQRPAITQLGRPLRVRRHCCSCRLPAQLSERRHPDPDLTETTPFASLRLILRTNRQDVEGNAKCEECHQRILHCPGEGARRYVDALNGAVSSFSTGPVHPL